MKTLKCLLSAVAVAVGFSLTSQAAYTISKFRINQYYGNDAVLQRGVTLPICGTAEKGKTITVTFNGQTKTTTANIDTKMTADYNEGRWVVEFPAISTAGGSYTLTASDGTKTLTNTGLTVGEVWVVSGQSNAQYPVKAFTKQEGYSVDFASEWLQDANYSNLHFIKPTEGHLEWSHTPDTWKISSSATAGECSAMGFFFAKELLKSMTTQIPVGIVAAATDGSLITQWIPGDTSSKDHYTKMINNYLEPLPPFPVKGVLWYQGESDGMFGFSSDYPARLTTLVTNWREIWNNPTMPFIIVQLPFYGQYGQWSEIRLAQNQVAASVPGVYVMPTLDIGDLAMIHPPKKPELGKRLSEYARKYVYGESGVNPEGPLFRSWEMNPNNDHEVIIRFDVHGSITSKDGQALKGFMINGDYYGQKTKYYEVNVRMIDGYTIGVSPKDSKVNPPYIVRYGCNNMEPTEVNFYDSLGYSARAFSTAGFEASDAPVHEHNWNLTLNGSVLTATCSNSGCTSGTPTFSLAGTDTKVYDGQPLELHKSGTDFAALTSSELGLVEYYQNGVKISGLPTEVGTYEARVDVDHNNVVYTLKKTITITAAQENPPVVNPPASGDDPAGAIAATGDTTGAQDVSAIQAAINAAKPTKGTVTLGSGIFYINTQLLVEEGVTLQGQGWDKTIIKQVASGADCRVATVDGGSTVKNLTLTGGRVETTGNYKAGGGVSLKNGTISWCCITNNLISAGNVIVGGGVGLYAGKGQIDHSIIADNTVSSSGEFNLYGGGIGIYQASGAITVDSCLIYGNTSVMTKGHRSGNGGGIGVNGSYNTVTVRNTTIVGNVAGKSDGDNKEQSKGGGVYCDGGTFKLTNCIIADNETAQSGYDIAFHNTTVALDHCLYQASELTNDAANRQTVTACASGDPKFTNAAARDFTLASASPAKNAGATYTGIGVDLAGNNFAATPSMGCYEFGSTAGTVPAPGGDGEQGGQDNPPPATHTHNWGTPTYSWSSDNTTCTATATCTGDSTHKTNKTVTATSAVVKEATTTETGTKRYTATFAAPFATQTKDVTIPKVEETTPGGDTPSNPPVVNPPSVDPTGAQAASGDTSGATDTKTIQDLIDAAAPTHGTVKLGEGTFYINTELMVTNGVTLVGLGWEKTIIKQASKATFQTYTRCVTIDGGAKVQGVTLTGGQCYGQWSRSGAGAHIVDGTVSWCCISNNVNTALGSARGGGIYIEKGTVDHSIIANNNGGTGVGGGIGGHWDLGKFVGPVVIDTCLFYGNTVKGDGAAIGFTGDAGMNIQIRNTTIADNVATGASGGINCLKYELVNSIVTGNTGSSGEENVAGTSQSTSSNNLVGGDAKFANAAAGNYTLTASSPAKGAGVSYSGLGLDLTGASFANPPSIGCYEYGAGTAPTDPEQPTVKTKVIFYVD